MRYTQYNTSVSFKQMEEKNYCQMQMARLYLSSIFSTFNNKGIYLATYGIVHKEQFLSHTWRIVMGFTWNFNNSWRVNSEGHPKCLLCRPLSTTLVPHIDFNSYIISHPDIHISHLRDILITIISRRDWRDIEMRHSLLFVRKDARLLWRYCFLFSRKIAPFRRLNQSRRYEKHHVHIMIISTLLERQSSRIVGNASFWSMMIAFELLHLKVQNEFIISLSDVQHHKEIFISNYFQF